MKNCKDVICGKNVQIYDFTNLYGCHIGDDTKIGTFVEVQRGAVIGARCKISSHSFICEGVTIEDEVFIGHGVMFTNDKHPQSCNSKGLLAGVEDWTMMKTLVKRGASIGSGSTILPGLTIGENSVIGAGSVVTKDVLNNTVVFGNPAKVKS
ncbi:MAG: N-acetyltransferase [Candidatus Cloacimonetes bacterium]|nr:N-acetyltransferase [Candidatus Cloacimonadota bacterium]